MAFNANKIQEEISDFENGLKKLFEITGVNDVNEVIQKFITQDETENSLQLTRENYSEGLDELVKVKARLRETIEELKFDKTMHVGNHQLETCEEKVNKQLMRMERCADQDQGQQKKDVQAAGRGQGGRRAPLRQAGLLPPGRDRAPGSLAGLAGAGDQPHLRENGARLRRGWADQ